MQWVVIIPYWRLGTTCRPSLQRSLFKLQKVNGYFQRYEYELWTQGRNNKIVSSAVFAIKICSCEFLGVHIRAVEFSVLVSYGTSLGDGLRRFETTVLLRNAGHQTPSDAAPHIRKENSNSQIFQKFFRGRHAQARARMHTNTHTSCCRFFYPRPV